MKRLFWLLLFLPSGLFAVQITDAQAVQVSTTSMVLRSVADQLYMLGTNVHQITGNGGYGIQVSTQAYALTPAQQQDIVNLYQSLKAQLQAVAATLP